jgi:uncharacterized protein
MVFDLAPRSAFGYWCQRCSRCCHDQRIHLSPYELVRIARNRGLCTRDVIARHTVEAGTVLRFDGPERACVFLGREGCGVHPDRPLACRLYPLGRCVSATGESRFTRLSSHPQSEGIFTPPDRLGPGDTVDRFVRDQGAEPYLGAADRYFDLFRRLRTILEACAKRDPCVGEIELRPKGISNWADVDSVVAAYCVERGQPVPEDAQATIGLHMEAMACWAAGLMR